MTTTGGSRAKKYESFSTRKAHGSCIRSPTLTISVVLANRAKPTQARLGTSAATDCAPSRRIGRSYRRKRAAISHSRSMPS
jgi:hypothetical protein